MTSLLTGLALCFPLHLLQLSLFRCSPPSRRPAIASPPPPLIPLHLLLFPTTCTFSVAIRIARTSMHRCALSRARVARSRTFTQPRIEHRLPALTGRVQRSLGSHRLALSRPGRSAWSSSLSLSHPLFFSLTPSIATSLAPPRNQPDTSYLVLSLPASRPFLCPPFLLFSHL